MKQTFVSNTKMIYYDVLDTQNLALIHGILNFAQARGRRCSIIDIAMNLFRCFFRKQLL